VRFLVESKILALPRQRNHHEGGAVSEIVPVGRRMDIIQVSYHRRRDGQNTKQKGQSLSLYRITVLKNKSHKDPGRKRPGNWSTTEGGVICWHRYNYK